MSATNQSVGRAGFPTMLRHQAQAISFETQGQPISGLKPQQLPQPRRDHQLPLGRQREQRIHKQHTSTPYQGKPYGQVTG